MQPFIISFLIRSQHFVCASIVLRNLVIITAGFGGSPQSPSRHSVNTLRTDFLDGSSIKNLSTNRNTHGWVKLGSKVDIGGEGAQPNHKIELIVKTYPFRRHYPSVLFEKCRIIFIIIQLKGWGSRGNTILSCLEDVKSCGWRAGGSVHLLERDFVLDFFNGEGGVAELNESKYKLTHVGEGLVLAPQENTMVGC